MNGPIALLCVKNTKPPNNIMVTSMGVSHNFLRTRRNFQNSARKLIDFMPRLSAVINIPLF